jgi:catechol 2,3-dioxygenase-like lactoylglutathione lyase family enzyme
VTDASPPPAFGFVKIVVRDLPKMLDFYDRTVGLREVRTIESDVYIEVMTATPGMEKGPFVILFYNKDDREISVGNGWGPVGFWVTGVDSTYRHALANGAVPHREPYDSNGFRIAYFLDPEGHEVELVGTPG